MVVILPLMMALAAVPSVGAKHKDRIYNWKGVEIYIKKSLQGELPEGWTLSAGLRKSGKFYKLLGTLVRKGAPEMLEATLLKYSDHAKFSALGTLYWEVDEVVECSTVRDDLRRILHDAMTAVRKRKRANKILE